MRTLSLSHRHTSERTLTIATTRLMNGGLAKITLLELRGVRTVSTIHGDDISLVNERTANNTHRVFFPDNNLFSLIFRPPLSRRRP